MKIIEKNDYTNTSIRTQPLEFLVTLVERIPSLAKKDQQVLKALLDVVFKIMIDIDTDIDESWMRPKEGFSFEEDEDEDDAVNFGKSCVDRLISSVGEDIAVPLISQLIQNTIANETDWRFKHAGLMALSQIGEYVEEVATIQPMVPVIITNMNHENPKVRYAALHAVGQIADDMSGDF